MNFAFQAVMYYMKLTIRVIFLTAMSVIVTSIITYTILLLTTTVDKTVFGDIAAMISIWLPFRLNTVFLWAFTSAGMFGSFILIRFANDVITRFTSD